MCQNKVNVGRASWDRFANLTNPDVGVTFPDTARGVYSLICHLSFCHNSQHFKLNKQFQPSKTFPHKMAHLKALRSINKHQSLL